MTINFKSGYKIIFIIGLLFGFASLFLDWYYFQGVNDSGEIVIYWVYSALFDWSSPFSQGAVINDFYEPKNASLPVAIVTAFLVVIFLSAYSVLFLDAERKDNLPKLKKIGFVNLSLVILIGFFILIYPLFFLLPNGLYYPFLVYYNNELEITLCYSLGPGYFLQLISFACTFPYAMFNHSVINTFEKEQSSVENKINQYISSIREDLDLDKLIAREEFKLESKNSLEEASMPKSEAEKIYSEFLTFRGAKVRK
ncbi:hypothetical protein ES703_12585 [subsurface metagenome]